MSRAYGKESKIHIKRSGNNDSEIREKILLT
jgi:hypothetical protein